MSFETALANSLASMNSISRPFVSTALTDFRTSMQAELVSYGLKTGEKNWLDDQLFELGRELAVELKNRNDLISQMLLGEDGGPLTDESNRPLLLES